MHLLGSAFDPDLGTAGPALDEYVMMSRSLIEENDVFQEYSYSFL